MLSSAFQNKVLEAGCDEVGRGCLAGPVFAAAVIFAPGFYDTSIQDSKKLSSVNRIRACELIQKEAIAYAVGRVEVNEIDEINILQASVLAMHKAIDYLETKPGFLIIDGNYFHSYGEVPHQCFVGGDSKYLSIAAASILAKTCRDAYMQELHDQYPQYDWAKNKGYATLSHRKAVLRWGLSPYHRKTFHIKEF